VREGETGNRSRSWPGPPRSGREAGLGHVRRDYVQDERYIAIEHMDVRRDWFRMTQGFIEHRREDAAPTQQDHPFLSEAPGLIHTPCGNPDMSA